MSTTISTSTIMTMSTITTIIDGRAQAEIAWLFCKSI
jgi:hypothetical protein